MIDVHVVLHPTDDRRERQDRLFAQLEREPVNVHLVQGTECIGWGRAEGFARGDAPLVSYVDDDDSIVEGIYTRILEEFEKHPHIHGAVTRERANNCVENTFFKKYYDYINLHRVHHISTWRRELVTPHLDAIRTMRWCSEHYVAGKILIDAGIIKHIPQVGYTWDIHPGSTTNSKNEWPAEALALFRKLKNKAAALKFKTHLPELQGRLKQ